MPIRAIRLRRLGAFAGSASATPGEVLSAAWAASGLSTGVAVSTSICGSRSAMGHQCLEWPARQVVANPVKHIAQPLALALVDSRQCLFDQRVRKWTQFR